MRPYFAVIADSFRSAFASRVLWVALGVIYLFLLVISPIGYQEVYTTTFRWTDFANGTRLKAMLAQGISETAGGRPAAVAVPTDAASGPQPLATADRDTDSVAAVGPPSETPAGRIARHLPAELQSNLRKVAEGQEVRIRLDILAEGLNSLYQSNAWYDANVWARAAKLRELRELEQSGATELTDELRKRRDRLRIEAALPGVFESRGARSIALSYAGFKFPAIFQVEKPQFQSLLNLFVLRLIVDWVLGFGMIFLGILVTASIIPDMLQPGSLHLLLSKPVSRPLLFLAKFIGGCAFVLVCVTQLIIGLWLIAGLRLDIWNPRLLWCIPVCVFLFSVFFSVSAVAGLRWRSPILAIGLANLFGAACLIIGLGATLSDRFIRDRDRITGLSTAGPALIASTRGGHLRRFDPEANRWTDLFPDDTGSSDRVMPPVTLSDGRVISARVRGGRMNLFGSGATPLLLIDPAATGLPEPTIEMPAGTRELLPAQGGDLLAINSGELLIARGADLRPEDQPAEQGGAEPTKSASPPTDSLGTWFPKLVKMMGGPIEGFQSVLPSGMSLLTPNSATLSPDGQRLFVYSGGKLLRLDRGPATAIPGNRPEWSVGARSETESAGRSAWLRCLGDSVLLLRTEAPPLIFSPDLEPITAPVSLLSALGELTVTSAVACPSGGWDDADTAVASGPVAIRTADGQAWILSQVASGEFSLQKLRGIFDVEAIHWDRGLCRLWVAHDVDRASAFTISAANAKAFTSSRPTTQLRPTLAGWRLLDRYLVTPLRTVTPQTGELSETISAIVSGENSMQLPFMPPDDPDTIQQYDVWRPVLTCGAFVAAMLMVGCVYFARADF